MNDLKKSKKCSYINLFVRSIHLFKKFFNSSNNDDDIIFIIQKQTHFVQIYYKTMINLIKKCFLYDLINDSETISSHDQKNH